MADRTNGEDRTEYQYACDQEEHVEINTAAGGEEGFEEARLILVELEYPVRKIPLKVRSDG